MHSDNRQIKFGAVISYLAICVNLVLALLYTPWMVARIGQSNYALYTLSTSLISIFLMDFGIGSSVARFLAKYRAEQREDNVSSFLGVVYKLFLLIAVGIFVVLTVLYFFLEKIYSGLSAEEITVFKKLYIIVSGYSILSFPFIPFDGILNSYEKFIQLKLCGLVQKCLSVLLIIAALLADLSVTALVSANAVSGMFTIFLKWCVIRKAGIPRPDLRCRSKTIFKEIFSFSVWVTVMSIAQRCMFNLAPSILGMVSSSREIATFSPANALEGIFYVFSAAINGLFLPKISGMVASGDRKGIMRLMISVGKYQMVLLGLIYVGFCIVGKDFMILWMGKDYINSYYGAILIFLPDLLIFSQQIANTLMVAENKVKLQAYGYLIMAAVCLSCSFPLSKYFGCIGACLAIAVGYLANFIYINVIYVRVIKLDMKQFYKSCYLHIVPIMVAAAIILSLFFRILPSTVSWIWLLIKAGLVAIVYLAGVLLFGLSREEKTLLFSLLKRGKKYE